MTDQNSAIKNSLLILLVLALVALTSMLIKQKSNATRIQQENQELIKQIEHASSPVQPPASTPDSIPTTESTPVATTPGSTSPVVNIPPAVEPAPVVPPPPAAHLSLEQSTVTSEEGALRASLKFKPDNSTPLGEVFLVTRLPIDSGVKIVDIELKNAESYTELNKRITDDGRFAAIRALAVNVDEVEFTIAVSDPSVLDVRGTLGVGPFDLDIAPGHAVVTPK